MVTPVQILGPDYNQAPLVMFDLSGTQLVLRLPDHKAEFEPVLANTNIDINDDTVYERQASFNTRVMDLVLSSWNYQFCTSLLIAGGIILSISLNKVSLNQNNLNSLLLPTDFQNWLLKLYGAEFERLDKKVEEEFTYLGKVPSEKDMWIYPKKIEDLNTFNQNGVIWCRGRNGHPSIDRLDYWLSTPITKNHGMIINIAFDGFVQEQIGSAETVDALLESYIQEFLEHLHIEYTPETLAELKKYK